MRQIDRFSLTSFPGFDVVMIRSKQLEELVLVLANSIVLRPSSEERSVYAQTWA